MAAIPIDHTQIADFCRRHHVRKLSFFGSVLRDDFGPESDIDVLVEFEPGETPGFFEIVRMEDELARILGMQREVDLRTPFDLGPRFRDAIVADAEPLYAG